MSSGAAADGHVPTADGSGGVAWEAPAAGGGGGGNDPTAFASRVLAANVDQGDVTEAAGIGTQILNIADADIDFNEGGFTVTTVNNLSVVSVPAAGKYQVSASLDSVSGGTNRYYLRLVLAVTKGATTTYHYGSSAYRRAGPLSNDIVSCSGSWLVDLATADTVTIHLSSERESTALFALQRIGSLFGMARVSGSGSSAISDMQSGTPGQGSSAWVAAGVNVPSGTWMLINFGTFDSLFHGDWHWVLVADLTARENGVAGQTWEADEAVQLLVTEENYIELGHTGASPDALLFTSHPGIISPDAIRVMSM